MALIGDVEASRAEPERDRLRRRILDALADPGPFEPLSAPMLTGGDEFKALFAAPGEALRLAETISDTLHPTRLRFGLGVGPLTAGTPSDPVGTLDGLCFHNARAALDQAKAGKRWVVATGWPSPAEAVANGALRLVGSIRAGWTDKQASYATAMHRHGGLQKDVAKRLNITPSTLSLALKAARYAELDELMKALAVHLDAVARKELHR